MFSNKLTKTGNLTVEGEDPKKKAKDKGGASSTTNKKGSRVSSRSKGVNVGKIRVCYMLYKGLSDTKKKKLQKYSTCE